MELPFHCWDNKKRRMIWLINVNWYPTEAKSLAWQHRTACIHKLFNSLHGNMVDESAAPCPDLEDYIASTKGTSFYHLSWYVCGECLLQAILAECDCDRWCEQWKRQKHLLSVAHFHYFNDISAHFWFRVMGEHSAFAIINLWICPLLNCYKDYCLFGSFCKHALLCASLLLLGLCACFLFCMAWSWCYRLNCVVNFKKCVILNLELHWTHVIIIRVYSWIRKEWHRERIVK